MSKTWLVVFILILLAACSNSTAVETPVSATASPTFSATETPTVEPTLTPTFTLTPEPSVTPTATPIPLPMWPNDFQLGASVNDMAAHYELMLQSGMTWVRVYYQDGSGSSPLGPTITSMHYYGLRVLVTLAYDTTKFQEEGFVQLATSLSALGADAIEVGHQPNIDSFGEGLMPEEYTALLCKVHAAIKAVNPEVLVISGAPAPTGWFGGCTPAGCDDLPWLEGLYSAGAADCMDYIGAHHLSGATSPSATIGHPANPGDTHHSWFFLPQTQLYYDTFGGTRQVFYTTMGYLSQEGFEDFSDRYSWASGTDNAEQAAWLAEAVELSISTGMVHGLIVWNMDYERYGSDPMDGYALIRPDGTCPACDKFQEMLLTQP